MTSNAFRRLPTRRIGALAAATVVAAGPAALGTAATAHATDDHRGGRAGAVVLRTGLEVSLLNKTVRAPLDVALNDVSAPASASRTTLTAKLDGVEGGQPFSVLRADVATARATVKGGTAEGYSNVARAKVHVPGLPLLPLVEVDQVTSKAVCAAGKRAVASSTFLGGVTVLGKKVGVKSAGTTQVSVPGVGEVRLDLSSTRTTSRTAAATALRLQVSVDPLKLGVAAVEGTVTLAGASCVAPGPGAKPLPEPKGGRPAEPVAAKREAPRQEKDDLAETGGSSLTPYVAGGAVVLLLAGGGALVYTRRR
ncbi:SCO1860 family LAETG-anchored protein [Streptomyces spectabilis]|uniref:LPXTG cell wall anchor domain-containing protein n=1 Tax=Streptomyces spectabilis TaxID=68270 RepID=A0A5P2X841_STRST|nr:SCO1860 family LAETG-anchored protein [Streptomyces spectabilis]MBB5108542.1 LPXTG-motif cell wall-anchored protein [Streptomyces spectabilis]MCI3901757.1 LPXTG cell wall anchor domain-containing protein [Streptomyces spectabilis]QEV59190.1 LPXTG cell wall anchor domain-containing protein [Streptomyces spectabilis]GGV47286.1 LPXTG cell wall anchor domain-containing protein [Streptomyces spectabilis]